MLALTGGDEPLGEAVIAALKITRIGGHGYGGASEWPPAHEIYLKALGGLAGWNPRRILFR
jgi:hypothetical protein